MLVSRRTFFHASVGASHATHAVVHSRFRLHAVRSRGIVLDDRLYLRGPQWASVQSARTDGTPPAVFDRGMLARPIVSVPLAGRLCVLGGGRVRWLEPGELVVAGSKAAMRVRQQDDYCGL